MEEFYNDELNFVLVEKLNFVYDKIKKVKSKNLKESKLTIPQISVLEVVKRKGSSPLKTIGEELKVTGANITCIIDNLEKENLIKRSHSKQDRRVILAELTEDGEKKVSEIFPNFNEKMDEVFGKLDSSEKHQLLNLLIKLNT